MSRFPGWTMKDIEKLNSKEFPKSIINYDKNYDKNYERKVHPDYPGQIYAALQVLGINSVREYRFLKDRRFKFDLAIPLHNVAIEFEGGIFRSGRHTRGKGFANDAKKYNLAVLHGWKLLRYTSADVNKLNWEYAAADEIKTLIEGSKP